MLSCPLFGWRTTNFVESDNNNMLVNRMRDSTPLEALKILAKAAMNKFSMRQDKLDKWTAQHLPVNPRTRALYQAEQSVAGNYDVARSSNGVWFASEQGYDKYRRIETEAMKCSCSTYRQIGIPCRHLLAVLHATGSMCDVTAAFHPSYLVKNFKQRYMGKTIELVVSTKTPAVLMYPPLPTKNSQRRQKRRIGISGETKPVATYKCRLCTQAGHNRTICRRHANPATRKPETIFGHAVDLDDVVGSVISAPLVATNFEMANTTLS